MGCLLGLVPDKARGLKGWISFIFLCVVFYFSLIVFKMENSSLTLTYPVIGSLSKFFHFRIDPLSKLVVLFIGFFGMIISLYSLRFVDGGLDYKGYYSKFLWTLAASFGAVLSDNLITFTLFWGFLGLTLYRFLRGSDERSVAAAKKSFILIGASDSILIMGLGLLWLKTGHYMISGMKVTLSGEVSIIAFLSLLIASLAKAGAFPVHSWVPDYTQAAPGSVSAFLPASLDKLLGIYFLARICTDIFILTPWAKLLLLTIGSVTIITAVMMALVQHNYKKLLGYHAVSQVGYMVTGLGLGSPIGMAGGLFHMINHALYKSGLFLTAGAVEKKTGQVNIENLGGLSTVMPFTFLSALIFALSISGVPPFNGFVSKWIIYQGIIDFGKGFSLASHLWVIWLGSAVIGSALTLASFIKLIGGIYLGAKRSKFKNIKETHFLMSVPYIIIALLCVGFGIAGTSVILPELITPVTGPFRFIGLWESQTVGILILLGILLGVIIYLMGNIKKIKTANNFIGGEYPAEDIQYPSVEFYKTLTDIKPIGWIYQKAREKYFDVYDWGKKIVLWASHILSGLHTGVLTLYVVWTIISLGLIILLLL
ncbi:MAG: hypothetical protein JW827_01650 [Spirochaetes bacterium]|nr:hypothetical protein [Spirochaetota bacterium]